jgi:hypothetical protein
VGQLGCLVGQGLVDGLEDRILIGLPVRVCRGWAGELRTRASSTPPMLDIIFILTIACCYPDLGHGDFV